MDLKSEKLQLFHSFLMPLAPSLCSGSGGEEWEISSWDIMPGVESKALDMAGWSLPSLIAMAGHLLLLFSRTGGWNEGR